MGAAVGGAFISYRVADSCASAILIDRELSSRFGSVNVFLDSKSTPVGSDFAEELLTRLRECSVPANPVPRVVNATVAGFVGKRQPGRFRLFGRPDHRGRAGGPAIFIFYIRRQSAIVIDHDPAGVACRWSGAVGAATTASTATGVTARLHRSCRAVGRVGSVVTRRGRHRP